MSFCSPDFAGFGIARPSGFFDKIHIGIEGCQGLVDLQPHEDRPERLGYDSDGSR